MAIIIVQVDHALGPSFGPEIIAAGLGGLEISWSSKPTSATVRYNNDPDSNGLTAEQIITLITVIENHDPSTPAPISSDTIMREFVVEFATTLNGLSLGQRKTAIDDPNFQVFLDYIITLGEEGVGG